MLVLRHIHTLLWKIKNKAIIRRSNECEWKINGVEIEDLKLTLQVKHIFGQPVVHVRKLFQLYQQNQAMESLPSGKLLVMWTPIEKLVVVSDKFGEKFSFWACWARWTINLSLVAGNTYENMNTMCANDADYDCA